MTWEIKVGLGAGFHYGIHIFEENDTKYNFLLSTNFNKNKLFLSFWRYDALIWRHFFNVQLPPPQVRFLLFQISPLCWPYPTLHTPHPPTLNTPITQHHTTPHPAPLTLTPHPNLFQNDSNYHPILPRLSSPLKHLSQRIICCFSPRKWDVDDDRDAGAQPSCIYILPKTKTTCS